ncbi:MAG: Hsp70 family protein [Rhodopila sp.]
MPTYLGIDFGTSNTHVAYCNDQGDGALTAVAIKIAGKSPTATCVLWGTASDGSEIVEAFGTVAMETWSQYDHEEQAGRRIACGFKPDIARSERARIDARAFLAKVCQAVIDVQPAAVRAGQTIIGVPAEISQEHRDRTREIVRAAGFAEAVCVDEPLGALAYHLTNGSITPSEAHIGIVVVDFGGGTLDLALVTAEQGLRAPWGDPALGGRLFDDLFYQWIQDQNGEFEVSEREALAVWQQECREMKESFSRRWAMIGDGMNDFRFRIDVGDGRRTLRNASVAEFLERARAYRPSPLAVNYFQRFGFPGPLANGKPIDLLAWIRRTMQREGAGGPLKERFSKVVLTGGSSEWPFMRGIAAEVFGVNPETGILRSDDPEATVGSGLALYNALRARHRARREELIAAPAAAEDVAQAVTTRLEHFAEDVATATIDATMPRIEAAFKAWYQRGGSLKDVEAEVTAICEAFEPEATALIEESWRSLDADLLRVLRDNLRDFLRAHEIARDVSRYVPEAAGTVSLSGVHGGTSDRIANELAGFAGNMAVVATGIGALVIATVNLHVIVLLAVAHPILAVVAGIGALATWLGMGSAVGGALENAVREHQFNAFSRRLLHWALPETRLAEKLNEGRMAAQDSLKQKILESLETAGGQGGIVGVAVRAFRGMIEAAVADLGVLEELAKSPEAEAAEPPAILEVETPESPAS